MRSALLAVLLLAPGARAATLTGADWGNQPLTPANGDTLSGTFTNVSSFTVGAGTTVFVAAGTPLVVYAATVSIRGVINGVGRGQSGGDGGVETGIGLAGFGDGPGLGAGAGNGGGGGSHGGRGGAGAGALGGSTSAAYGAATTFTIPLSADDATQGSGGGGGGGGTVGKGGGTSGGNGGAAAYIEAASMTITGSILLTGATAAIVAGESVDGTGDIPGAGGGGGGGGLVLRITKALSLEGATLNAAAGNGGRISDPVFCRGASPGGGGGGGRVKLYYRAGTSFSVFIATSGGSPGKSDCVTGFDLPTASTGLPGTAAFGRVAAAASGFAASSVHVSSVAWTWAATPDIGDGAGGVYRVFPATATAPLTSPEAATAGLTLSATVQSLTPNTTYYRAVTAYTDWGDSALSNAATAFTLAADPVPAGFTATSASGFTASWTAGTPANPSYTLYRAQSSTDPAFGGGGTTDLVALSSSPTGLAANTTHYFRVRAVNVAGQLTAYTASFATATLAATPVSPGFSSVYVSSVAFSWSGAGNPAGTVYQAEASSTAFATLAGSSQTLNTSATFFALNTGTVFAFRVRAVNRNAVPTAYTTAVSTAAGLLGDTTPPTAPGRPSPDRLFSYDGIIFYTWAPATSGVGILKYKFFLGTTPAGDDVVSNLDVFVASHTVTGLTTGRTYYATVLPVSNAGVNGFSSESSAGTAVFLPGAEKAIAKPFNWPNPFDPATGATQIGVFLDAPADVTLKVYDLQGGLVSESSRRIDAAGNQVLTWDGRDSRGARVAPGGYVCVIRKNYGGRADTQKLKIAVLY